MKPAQPNTNLTHSSQPPSSCQTRQRPTIIVDDSTTESNEGDSPLRLESDDLHSFSLPEPENQLGLEEWERQRRRHYGIPEVPEPADKTSCGVQVSQNESVGKDNTPGDTKIFLSLDGQNQVKIEVNGIDTHCDLNISFKQRTRGTKRKLEVEYVVRGEQAKRQKGSSR